MRKHKIKQIESMFRGGLEKEVSRIKADFPNVSCSVEVDYPPNDIPTNGEPNYRFFSISLECILENAALDRADYLSVGMDVYDFDRRFTINADVYWGNPYAKAVQKIFPEPVEMTDENLRILAGQLPNLLLRLRKELSDNPHGKI